MPPQHAKDSLSSMTRSPRSVRPSAIVALFLAALVLIPGIVQAQAPATPAAPAASAPAASAPAASSTPPAAAAAPAPAASPTPSGTPAAAQPAPGGHEGAPLTADLDAVIKALKDDTARAALLKQLETLRAALPANGAAAAPTTTDMVSNAVLQYADQISDNVGAIYGRLEFAVRALPSLWHWAGTSLSDPESRADLMHGAFIAAAALAAAILASFLVARLLARLREAIEDHATRSQLGARIALRLARMALDLLPIAAFAIAGSATAEVLRPDRAVRALTLTLINASVVTGLVAILLRAVLSPRRPALRMVPLDDATARSLFLSVLRIVQLSVWGYFVLNSLYLFGLPPQTRWALLFVLGIIIMVAAITFVLHWRSHFGVFLHRHITPGRWYTPLMRALAEAWYVVAIVYIVLLSGVMALQIAGGFEYLLQGALVTAVIVVLVPFLGALANRWARRPGADGSFFGTERGSRLRRLIARLASAVFIVAGLLIVLESWQFGVIRFLMSTGGRVLSQAIASIATVLIGALVIWEFVNNLIESRLNIADGDERALSSRARTLLQFVRNMLLVTLLVLVTLIVLSELGIDIAPLLAGAGVIGLAIGFGAQTLVKDVITGLFILTEDHIQVGDVVDLGGNSGVVEAMSVRSLRLRDGSGTLHIIPFSSVDRIKNMTRGFTFSLFNIQIAYKENVDRVTEIIARIGNELAADPKFSPFIVGGFEIFGLDAFTDRGYVIQARFKTRAGRQWTVSREFNRRLKMGLEAENIETPQSATSIIQIATAPDGSPKPIHLALPPEMRPAGPADGRLPDAELPDESGIEEPPPHTQAP